MGLPGAVSAEEYARWLRPDEAIDRMPIKVWGHGACHDALFNQLIVGGIRAVARRGRLDVPDGFQLVEFHLINAEFWDENLWIGESTDLWAVGNITFRHGSRLKERLGHRPDEWVEHIFTGVRFDPIGFEQAFDLEPADRSPPQAAKSIAAGEMERFARLYLEIWDDAATEMKALAAIRACYPEVRISRDTFLDKFRELRGPGTVGKPRGNKN